MNNGVQPFTLSAWREQLIIAIISSSLPFRIVENKELQKVFHMLKPNLDIPHRTTIRSQLTIQFNTVMGELLSDLPPSGKVSIALDGWQSPFKLSFLAITAYYITTDWQWREVSLLQHTPYHITDYNSVLLDSNQ
jgi:hypothetical protein